MSAAPSLDPSGQAVPAPPALGADAAQELFERHSAAIYGYCLNRLSGPEEAEDAVQTTFLNAFRALRRGVVPEHESAWLYKIAENVCRGRHRSAGRRLEVVQDPTAIAEAAPAVRSRRDELFGLDEALERMAPRQRRALLLREWKGLSYREIGQELRLSPAAVETLLFRARRSLARNLQLGSLIPWLKSLLSSSAAVKAAAAAGVVVGSVALGGDTPLARDTRPAAPARATTVMTLSAGRPASSSEVGASPQEVVGEPKGTPARDGGRTRPSPAEQLRGSEPAASPGSVAPGTSAPSGEEPLAETPATAAPGPPSMPPTPTLPGAPSPPSPPPVSLPVQLPPPPVPPPPALPELPSLPSLLPPLPPPPALPPAPPLPAVPQLPAVPRLPAVPEAPELPELPQLP